jgi:putative addiction module antidote
VFRPIWVITDVGTHRNPSPEVGVVKLTVRKVGNSLGVTIPAQAIQALGVKEGDKLFLTETPDGYHITPFDPEFEASMKLAEGFMSRYRNALRELAK